MQKEPFYPIENYTDHPISEIPRELLISLNRQAGGSGLLRDTRAADGDLPYQTAPPQDLDHLLSHFSDQFTSSKSGLSCLELAIMCYKRFLDISPFESHNRETGQLLLELLLADGSLTAPKFTPQFQEDAAEAIRIAQKCYDMEPLIRLVRGGQ